MRAQVAIFLTANVIAVILIVSLLTPAPSKKVHELVNHMRHPHLKGDINTHAT